MYLENYLTSSENVKTFIKKGMSAWIFQNQVEHQQFARIEIEEKADTLLQLLKEDNIVKFYNGFENLKPQQQLFLHLCIVDKYDLYICRPELPTLLIPTLEKIEDFKFIPENLLRASNQCFEAIAEHC